MNKLIQAMAPAILIVAAMLKAYELHPRDGFFVFTRDTSWVIFEILVAILLVVFHGKKAIAFFGAGIFLVFSLVNFAKLYFNVDNCGCFGSIKIPPIWTLFIDLILAGSCIWNGFNSKESIRLQPQRNTSGLEMRWAQCILVVGIVLGLIFAKQFIAKNASVSALAEDHLIRDKPELLEGKWILVIVDESCEKCRSILPSLRSFAQANESDAPSAINNRGVSWAFFSIGNGPHNNPSTQDRDSEVSEWPIREYHSSSQGIKVPSAIIVENGKLIRRVSL